MRLFSLIGVGAAAIGTLVAARQHHLNMVCVGLIIFTLNLFNYIQLGDK